MAASFDIFPKLAQYYDPHMLLAFLDHYEEFNIYPREQIAATRAAIRAKTLLDCGSDENIASKLANSESDAKPVLKLIAGDNTEELRQAIEGGNFLAFLVNNGVTQKSTEAAFVLARTRYDSGDYARAAPILSLLKAIYQAYTEEKGASELLTLRNVPERLLSCLWGKAAAEIMSREYVAAAYTLSALKEHIDNHVPVAAVVSARVWLVHWELYVHFRASRTSAAAVAAASCPPEMSDFSKDAAERGKVRKVLYPDDVLHRVIRDDRYLAAVANVAPWALRHIVVAAVIARVRGTTRAVLREVARVAELEASLANDSVVQFAIALTLHSDPTAADVALRASAEVLETDFFTAPPVDQQRSAVDLAAPSVVLTSPMRSWTDEFVAGGWHSVFENICKVHSAVSLEYVEKALGLHADDAEKWVANVLRHNDAIDARVDVPRRQILISHAVRLSSSALRDRVKFLSLRTANLLMHSKARAATIERKAAQKTARIEGRAARAAAQAQSREQAAAEAAAVEGEGETQGQT